ncbi:hypothetical protein GCM10023075_36340 [Streptosporangium album]
MTRSLHAVRRDRDGDAQQDGRGPEIPAHERPFRGRCLGHRPQTRTPGDDHNSHQEEQDLACRRTPYLTADRCVY